MKPLVAWLILAGPFWSAAGALLLPSRYRQRGLGAGNARLAGGLTGAALGLPGLVVLYARTPRTSSRVLAPVALLGLAELYLIFRAAYPDNLCVTNGSYVADQVQNGLALGLVYATMAVGLALIFSVQGIVSFAHGQIFMLGGVIAYLAATHVWNTNPLVILPVVAGLTFLVGVVAERTLLSPLGASTVERPIEYALLVTFGLGLFLQYAVVGILGSARGVRVDRYTDHPLFGLDSSTIELGPLRLRADLWIAGLVGLCTLVLLAWFLHSTWTGISLRAVAMDSQAAAVVGINVARGFTLAFGIGTMLAGIAGALLVPAVAFSVPQIATLAGAIAYVVVVLGGLGSVWGALLAGLFIGVSESLGAGCFPDPSRGATYQTVFGLVIFAAVLVLRPQGLFGRER